MSSDPRCERCGDEATVQQREIVDGAVSQTWLCEACAAAPSALTPAFHAADEPEAAPADGTIEPPKVAPEDAPTWHDWGTGWAGELSEALGGSAGGHTVALPSSVADYHADLLARGRAIDGYGRLRLERRYRLSLLDLCGEGAERRELLEALEAVSSALGDRHYQQPLRQYLSLMLRGPR